MELGDVPHHQHDPVAGSDTERTDGASHGVDLLRVLAVGPLPPLVAVADSCAEADLVGMSLDRGEEAIGDRLSRHSLVELGLGDSGHVRPPGVPIV